MSRAVQDAKLDTPNARSKLKKRREPYWRSLVEGLAIGYRKTKTGGTWIARHYSAEHGRHYSALGSADGVADADGKRVLSFAQAQEKARNWARDMARGAGLGEDVTVSRALDNYEADLRTRGGDTKNVERLKLHLSADLLGKIVAALKTSELKQWRDTLATKIAPASVNRTATCLRAALNLAADHDERITTRPWKIGLKTIPGAEQPRNIILTDHTVRLIIEEAYGQSRAFGVLVELAAVTGARVSQIARLEVQDVQGDRHDPRLMMPGSKKGKGVKEIVRSPVPITADLALRLRELGANRPPNAPLLLRTADAPWEHADHSRPFSLTIDALRERIKEETHHNPQELEKRLAEINCATIYALRHSSIVRQLLANVPIRIVAVNHDTSVAMIERTYSRHIADHSDALARQALLSIAPPPLNVSDVAQQRGARA